MVASAYSVGSGGVSSEYVMPSPPPMLRYRIGMPRLFKVSISPTTLFRESTNGLTCVS